MKVLLFLIEDFFLPYRKLWAKILLIFKNNKPSGGKFAEKL